jgi:hypothetical protein
VESPLIELIENLPIKADIPRVKGWRILQKRRQAHPLDLSDSVFFVKHLSRYRPSNSTSFSLVQDGGKLYKGVYRPRIEL